MIYLVSIGSVIIFALVWAIVTERVRWKRRGVSDATASGKRPTGTGIVSPGTVKPKHCPLCGTRLQPGERVHSAVFPGKKDRLTHIFGCPHCYPENRINRRTCPVCKADVAMGAYVVARMFTRRDRIHVHVLGCGKCRKVAG